jgi:ABC-type transport system involved in multi-copper enzyme maturation permease subunit
MLQPHTLLRVIGVCAILSVVLMFFVSAGVAGLVQESPTAVDSMIMVVSGLLVLLLIVLGPAITSNAICSDRETGVWDLLRSTPLSGWRIVSGKFQAAVIPLLLLAMATGPALAILLQFRPALWPSVLGVGVVAGVSILFIATLGVFFSSVFRRTPTATAWTYGVVAGMAVAGLLMMLGGDVFSQRLVRTVFAVNPLAAALDAAGHPGMSDLGVAAVHVPLVLGATAVLFVATVARVLQLRRPEK